MERMTKKHSGKRSSFVVAAVMFLRTGTGLSKQSLSFEGKKVSMQRAKVLLCLFMLFPCNVSTNYEKLLWSCTSDEGNFIMTVIFLTDDMNT